MVFPRIDEGAFSHVMDFKSQLQELIQRDNCGMLQYKILQEKGPAHNREFISTVLLNGDTLDGMTESKTPHRKTLAKAIVANPSMTDLRARVL